MRVHAAVVVLAVLAAGWLERPAAAPATETVTVEPDDWWPRALAAAKEWRPDAIPVRVEGGRGYVEPPPGERHLVRPAEDVPARRSGGSGAGVSGGTALFHDPPSGDWLAARPDGDGLALTEFPASPPAAAPLEALLPAAEGGVLAPVAGLVDDAAPRPSTPVPAPAPALPTTPTSDASPWLRIWLRVAAWFAGPEPLWKGPT